MIQYDENGDCKACGLPGSGFVEQGVCMCGDDPIDEDALEEWDLERRQRWSEL